MVELLLSALPRGFDAHFLKGNHEAIMLDFLSDPTCLGQWLANGAAATFESYGVEVAGLVAGGSGAGDLANGFSRCVARDASPLLRAP